MFPVFPTTSRVAVELLNTGKYEENASTVGDCRG
jgi:predicted AlkP superfamily pyrophosphatase or phosphodiesterase